VETARAWDWWTGVRSGIMDQCHEPYDHRVITNTMLCGVVLQRTPPHPATLMEVEMAKANPLEGTYTWEVTNFSRITEHRWYSPLFDAGGHTWRILMFPKGHLNPEANLNAAKNLSLYLEVRPQTVHMDVDERYA
jgi:hypothetical protein